MPTVYTEPGIIEVVLNFKLFGIPMKIIIGIRIGTTVPSVGTMSNMLDAINGWASTTLMPLLSFNGEYDGSSAWDASSPTGTRVDKALTTPTVGGINQPALPAQNCVVVTFASGLRGRSQRGRAYVPCIPQAVETQSAVSSSYAGSLAAAFGELRDIIDAQGGELVIISRYHNKAPRAIATTTNVNTFIGRTPIANQRRRGLMAKQRA